MSKPKFSEFSLGTSDRHDADVALLLYAEKLEVEAKAAEQIGEQEVADRWRARAGGINAVDGQNDATGPGLRARIREQKPVMLAAVELPMIRNALAYYVKKLKAAAGTLDGLAEPVMAQTLKDHAQLVDERLLALFGEQTQMDLAAGTASEKSPPLPPPPRADQVDPQSLRAAIEGGDKKPGLSVERGGQPATPRGRGKPKRGRG